MARLIAVTGATGALGGRVVERLAAAGRRPRCGWSSATPRGRPQLPGAEVVANPGGYADGGRAPRGAGRRGHPLPGVGRRGRGPAAAAPRPPSTPRPRPGVQRIVYTSFVGARPDATFTLVRQHAATEEADPRRPASGHLPAAQHVRRLRPVLRHASRTAARSSPPRPGRAAPASSRATTWPTSPPPCCSTTPAALDGQALEVTGPEALTLAEAADGAHRGHRRARGVPRPDRRGGVGDPPALRAPGLGDRGLGDQLPGHRRRRAGHRSPTSSPG